MPLVRIDCHQPPNPEFKHRVGDCVYRAMRETFNVPDKDRFQILTDHGADKSTALVFDREYLGIARTDGVIFIQATISFGRSVELKQALYARIAELLRTELQVRPENVFINLVEVAKENWSFGHGEAQYVTR